MRHVSHLYRSTAQLLDFLQTEALAEQTGIVQLFSGRDAGSAHDIQCLLTTNLPQFSLIGTSTAGEIFNGACLSNSIVLQFIVFDTKVQVQPFYSPLHGETEVIELLQHPTLSPNIIIGFANALVNNAEALINALHQRYPSCYICGGNAADNNAFQGTYTLLADKLYTEGFVGIALYGEQLHANLLSFTGWHPIGQKFVVTDVRDNILYTLDHQPALAIYQQYLGAAVLADFPKTVMEFPLLVKRASQQFLRAPVGLAPDGQGVILAGALQPGDQVYFSFADLRGLQAEVRELAPQQHIVPVIYACAARKAFLQTQMEHEIARLGGQNRASGGFLYGEFASNQHSVSVHNLSTTLLVLAGNADVSNLTFHPPLPEPGPPTSLQTLAFLAKNTGAALNQAIVFLEQQQYALNYGSIVSMTDAAGNITYVNKKFEDISGYKSDELLGQNHRIIKNPLMPARVYQSLWRTITQKKPWQGLMLNRRKDGSAYYVKTIVVPLLNDAREICSFLSIRQDITDIVKARQTIKTHTTDALTGLPNRARLSATLKKQQQTTLAMLDVRNFKLLNDVWGMDKGDQLIKALAKRLAEYSTGLQLAPYRINGATFAVTSTGVVNIGLFMSRCEALKAQLEAHTFHIEQQVFDISLSMGIGISKTHSLALAESALSEAKLSFAAQSVVKTDEDLVSKQVYSCIEEVRDALAEKRLTAVFQPLVYVNSSIQRIKKYEALVRIDRGNGELLSPGAFLQHIKKTRLYGALTREIITMSFDIADKLNCVISVNLSIQDILDQQTKDFILDTLNRFGGSKIIFEITESEAIQDFANVAEFIKTIRQSGAKIAIDDFGSGYSNFAYLVEIKPDYIKIDGSIIKTVVSNQNSLLVTKGIIDMARSLNIETIAEFVSAQNILDCLTELNVDIVQGFHIGKPVSVEQLTNNHVPDRGSLRQRHWPSAGFKE